MAGVSRDLRRRLGQGGNGSRLHRRVALRLRDDTGAGLVSSVAGLLAFLAFLLLAVQILVHLLATSYVTAAAFDAARLASADSATTPSQAEAHGRAILGEYGSRVSRFHVAVGPQTVTVHVLARSPALLPAAFGRVVGTESIDRTVIVRREVAQCPGC